MNEANTADRSICDSLLNDLKGLTQAKFTREYPRGSVIFAEGENVRGVYVLCQGRAKISIGSAEGRTLVLRVAEPGELLGINATVSGQPYRATVKTLDNCRIDFIPREQFLKLLDRDKRAYAGVVRALSEKLDYVIEQTRLLFLSQSASEKLARLLLSWCKDGALTAHGTELDICLTHEELAQMICSSRETVTRLLTDLKQQEILHIANNRIVIRNRKALQMMAKS